MTRPPARMLRRRALLGGAAAIVLGSASGLFGAGCGRISRAGAPATTASPLPTGLAVASWEIVGGFVPEALNALRPPRLVAFGDGEVIADAAYRARLEAEELTGLVADLVGALGQPDATRRAPGQMQIVDAPSTRLRVWAGADMLTVTAEALDEMRDSETYSPALYEARDRLAAVHKDVLFRALPFVADRVRVVAQPVTGDAPDPVPWPAALAVPADQQGVAQSDLSGEAAREAVRGLTRDLDQRGAWPAYRTPDGRLLQASWRYLLSNE